MSNKKPSKPSAQSKSAKLSTWSKIWRISLAIIIPLGGGLIISLFTRNAMTKFGTFNQPPLAPPAILFPIAWTILYVLMGLASYFIWKKSYASRKNADKSLNRTALIIYATQLVFNFAWTPFFFVLDLFWFAFIWLLIMWALVLVLIIISYKISKPAFWMLLPYLLWCTFAAYLNCGIAILN